jgi:hypothetical protein
MRGGVIQDRPLIEGWLEALPLGAGSQASRRAPGCRKAFQAGKRISEPLRLRRGHRG